MSFEISVRVYWEDTDAGGIVYYANYLKYFERARTEWLRSFEIEQNQLTQTAGGLFVVGQATVHYHRPARLDDKLLVTACLQEMRQASFIIAQQVLLSPHRTVLCAATIRIGWVAANTFKPARIPPAILKTLKQ